MRWIEVAARVDNEAVEAVTEVFQRFAHGGVVIEYATEPGPEIAWNEEPAVALNHPVVVRGYLPRGREGAQRRRLLEQALWHLNTIWPLPPPQIREVDEDDWANAWKDHFFAHRVGERLVIKPSWREFDASPEDLVITLDPGMAFGTGLHPTTQLCLRSLESLVRPDDRVFDVGTGSGILAIAAAKLGAREVLAVDLDEPAVEAATANARVNALENVVEVRQGSVDCAAEVDQFDVVVANIIARVIIELAPQLAARVRVGGHLLVSGILDTRLDEVVSALGEAKLTVEQTLAEADWRALVCRK